MKKLMLFVMSLICVFAVSTAAYANFNTDMDENNTAVGIPIGGMAGEPDQKICPAGFAVVNNFLGAWQAGDLPAMYSLLDDSVKAGYSYEEASADFKLLEYKDYKISSARKRGDVYEFIISCGSWDFGDKDVKKMIIDGKSFKILMPSKHSPFKASLENMV
ncbi:MAG: hypothetical protein HQL28_07420 [Candidatus Omnitrophica bacterium]|nr:hypothetical protein [Candidatus Omnitrophota bacterium]